MNGFNRIFWFVAVGILLGGVPALAGTAGGSGLPGEMGWRSYFVPQAGRAYHCAIPFQTGNTSVLMIGGYGVPGELTTSPPPPNARKGAAALVGGDAWATLNGWQWFRAGYPGGATSRLHAGLVELNSQLFLLGGGALYSEDDYSTGQVWTSTDGISWSLVTDTAPWGPRQDMAVAAFAGYIWLIGGLDLSASNSSPGVKAGEPVGLMPADIWRSSDGQHWELVASYAPWGGCFEARAVVFNNQLWLIGGLYTSGGNGIGPKTSEFEVWHSYNGMEWSHAVSPPPWQSRLGHACVVYDGRIWLLGGQDLNTGNSLNDVWSSADGENWVQEPSIPWVPREYHAAVAVDGLLGQELWVIGGISYVTDPVSGGVNYHFLPEVWVYGVVPARVSVTLAPPVNGRIFLFPAPAEDGTWEENTILTALAVPDRGYHLANWTDALAGSTNPQEQLLLLNPITLGAVFEPDTSVRLVIGDSAGGSVSVSPAPGPDGTYPAGTSVTLSAQPDSGYVFSGWRGDITGTQPSLTVTLDRTTLAVPVFSPVPSGVPLPWTACFADCDAWAAQASLPDTDGDGLTDCQELCVATDPNQTDTDGDGMPDGWELRYVLQPSNPLDALLDPDEDGLTNLEEYLHRSHPLDAASPGLCVFVDSVNGTDASGRGSRSAPLRTLTYALSVISGTSELPGRVLLRPGDYHEPGLLHVPANVRVLGLGTPPAVGEPPAVMLTLRLTLAERTELAHVMLMESEDEMLGSGVPMVQVTGSWARIRNVWFQGNGQGLTAIHVLASAQPPVIVERCTFMGLGIGIRMDGIPPRLRLNDFDYLLGPALYFAAGSVAKEDPSGLTGAGDASDPNTGYNRFGAETSDPVVVSERTDTLYLQNNDWDTNDPAEAEKRVESAGPVVIAPVAAPGSALLANALFCTVVDAGTQQPITSATTTLRISAYRPVTENEKGVYAYPAVPDGSYTLTVSATGYQDRSVPVSLERGIVKSVTIGLVPPGGTVEPQPEPQPEPEPEPEPEPQKGCFRCRRDQTDSGTQKIDLADSMLMGVGLLVLARPRRGGRG